jgi:hypothetical protein
MSPIEKGKLLVPEIVSMLEPDRKNVFIRAISWRKLPSAQKASRSANSLPSDGVEELRVLGSSKAVPARDNPQVSKPFRL